ncbi:hypothetical protein Ptr902_13049 [Pyrenophora tritici-repentis]|nr:hypothetical protein A1F99_130180 [Pyrenophora tritici-repentis]KAI0574205.1 hypothetical protein Alg215_08724 [Pyrenophora tritici-repentis]KAI0609006.1 hypothetical protein TUN205_06750 [Pyrenophora tritici-repentis]KAI0620036.1 hypothetical protein TUN199_07970 [Pyrenophora tritici-repentis]KAI1530369.1 hypothetical protein PtrSN001C_008692 [Pyrenophora tritici-repentis]
MERIRPGTRNPLTQLITGDERLCKLAKAWHIGDMIQLPQLQNKLLDMFREVYVQHLKTHTRVPPQAEPFAYLAMYLGTFSKIERFLIDFYAGLSRFGGEFTDEELEHFPYGIAIALKHRRDRFVIQGWLGDLIANNSDYCHITCSEHVNHLPLQVALPYAQRSNSTVTSTPSLSGRTRRA